MYYTNITIFTVVCRPISLYNHWRKIKLFGNFGAFGEKAFCIFKLAFLTLNQNYNENKKKRI